MVCREVKGKLYNVDLKIDRERLDLLSKDFKKERNILNYKSFMKSNINNYEWD